MTTGTFDQIWFQTLWVYSCFISGSAGEEMYFLCTQQFYENMQKLISFEWETTTQREWKKKTNLLSGASRYHIASMIWWYGGAGAASESLIFLRCHRNIFFHNYIKNIICIDCYCTQYIKQNRSSYVNVFDSKMVNVRAETIVKRNYNCLRIQ